MKRLARALAFLFVAALGGGAAAQTAQTARFEVASVKPHAPDDPRVMMVARPGGRFVALNVPLRMVIRTAFQIQDDQIVGGPKWLSSERFDIEAYADVPGPPGPPLLQMLQSLLAERFQMTTHREKREIPVFALERARRDGPLGSGLRVTGCPEVAEDLSRPQPCANVQTGFSSLTLKGVPFDQFTPFLSPLVGRVVVDRTALDGRFDVDLKWTPEAQASAPGGGLPPADPNAISIFTAIQEQLGLKLTATRDTVEVLVIDTLEPPTPN